LPETSREVDEQIIHFEESEFDERYVVVLSDGAVADTGEVSKEWACWSGKVSA
jgi:hypothetical protein